MHWDRLGRQKSYLHAGLSMLCRCGYYAMPMIYYMCSLTSRNVCDPKSVLAAARSYPSVKSLTETYLVNTINCLAESFILRHTVQHGKFGMDAMSFMSVAVLVMVNLLVAPSSTQILPRTRISDRVCMFVCRFHDFAKRHAGRREELWQWGSRSERLRDRPHIHEDCRNEFPPNWEYVENGRFTR